MDKIRKFLENGKWRQWKKSDWVVLALVGVLFLVITLPADFLHREKTLGQAQDDVLPQSQDSSENNGGFGEKNDFSQDAYTAVLEERLEQVLGEMEGVGRVKVMVSLSDTGEWVVEKDNSVRATTTAESDSAGGTRTTTEQSSEEKTIYVDTGEETYPYVQKEKLPAIEGVVVVAEGGGNPAIVSDISDAIKALFPVEAHRIKVVKMCSKEE